MGAGLAAAAAAAAVLLAGCSADPPTVFWPGGAGASVILTLLFRITAILSVVLLTVWFILTFVILRYRKRKPEDASQRRGNLKLEIIWLVIPAIIVSVLFAMTLITTKRLMVPGQSVRYTAIGHQWWWQFEFPGFTTANEIHLPVGQTARADLESADVIHSYWVPQMGGKVDMIPGRVNQTVFEPDKLGSYLGICSQFCGAEHAKMHFLLVVDTPAAYQAWLADQRLPAAQPTGADAVAGGQLIQTIACAGCHTIRGTPMAGKVGPDLTHFGSRQGIAAMTLPNTPANLYTWLSDTQGVKPGARMPQIVLPPSQYKLLVAYLEELK